MAVDLNRLPDSSVLDTTVLIPALRRSRGDEHSAEFWDAMVATRRTMLVPTPSLAELLRKSATPVPRTPSVQVVPFDAASAEILGRHFPKNTLVQWRDAMHGPLDYYKFDAMILAICKRHGVALLSLDGKRMTTLAKDAGVKLHRPEEFQAAQTSIAFPSR